MRKGGTPSCVKHDRPELIRVTIIYITINCAETHAGVRDNRPDLVQDAAAIMRPKAQSRRASSSLSDSTRLRPEGRSACPIK